MEPSVPILRRPRPPRSHQVPRAGYSGQEVLEPSRKMPPPSELFVLGRNVNKALDDVGFGRSFHPRVIGRLSEVGLAVPSALQKALVNNLLEGSESIIVHKASLKEQDQLRRTMTYMLPILNYLRDDPARSATRKWRPEAVEPIAPRVIVVTPSVAVGYKLSSRLHRFLATNPFMKTLNIDFLTTASYNGCTDIDVLITDIKSIQQSRMCKKNCFSFERLKFLVFEEAQCYLEQYGEDVKDTVNIARSQDAFLNQQKQLRLIVSSSRWNIELESFYAETIGHSSVIYIESQTEVANLAKVKAVVDYLGTSDAKIDSLKDLAETRMSGHKGIAIACSTVENAQIIANAMLDYASKVEVISSSTRFTECVTPKCYHYDKREIVIITDDLLDQAGVKNCTYFVSFDGATQKIDCQCLGVANLGLQFMWNSMPKLQDVDSDEVPFLRKNLVANYLLGGEAGPEKNIGDFYIYSKQLNDAELSLKFEKIGKQVWSKSLMAAPLCEGFKVFGACKKPSGYSCLQRHQFNNEDLEATVPGCGEIEFTVVGCDRSNLNAYKGKLLHHYVNQDNKQILLKSYEEEHVRRSQLLKSYPRHKLEPKDIVLGGVYGAHQNESYFRAKVLKINPSNPNQAADIFVEFIDEGKKLLVSSRSLFKVPVEVINWPPLVIDVILGDLCPPNNELEFIEGAMSAANNLALNNTFRGMVWLSFGNTVWVNPMMKQNGETFSLRAKFMAIKAASANPKHLYNLLESAKKLGRGYKYLSYIHNELEKRDFGELYRSFHKQNDPFSWAFLELDEKVTGLPIQMRVSAVTDPWLFHGTQSSFEILLKGLEDSANTWANAFIKDHGTSACDNFFNSLEQERCVLAIDKDSLRWKRAMTTRRTTGSDGFEVFDVFLVDSGKILKDVGRDDLLPIPKDLVNKLPFQAIALSLNHVAPQDGCRQWSKKETEIFQEMISQGDGYIHVTALKHKSAVKSGAYPNYYIVLTLYGSEELGTLLVKKAAAVETEDTAKLATSMQSQFDNFNISDLIDENDDDDKDNYDDDKYDVVLGNSGDSQGWLGGFIDNIKDLSLKDQSAEEDETKDELTSPKFQQSFDDKDGVETNLTSAVDAQVLGSSPKDPLADCTANGNLLCPTVYWHQTKNHIVFMIQIVDIKDFILSVGADGRTINFSTPKYGFSMKLFGKVLRQFASFPTGQRLRVVFTKRNTNCDPWVRINQDQKEKLKWLKKDPDYLEESDDDEQSPTDVNRPTFSDNQEHSDDSVESDEIEDKLFAAPTKYWNDTDQQEAEAEVNLQLKRERKAKQDENHFKEYYLKPSV